MSHARYERYAGALEDLSARLAQAGSGGGSGPQQRASSGRWPWIKAHRGSLLLLFSLYSVSTASVVGAWMAEARLQGEQATEAVEAALLRESIAQLEATVASQGAVLVAVRGDIAQAEASWLSSSGRLRRRLQARLSAWREEQQQAGGSSNSPAGGSSSGAGGEAATAGVRVGQLGRGFVI